MTQMSKDIVGDTSIKKAKSIMINEREQHIVDNKEKRRLQIVHKDNIKYFVPRGIIVDYPIIDDYYRVNDKGEWIIKSDIMKRKEIDEVMLSFHEVLSVSEDIKNEIGIDVGDYVLKKAGTDYDIIRINGLDYIIFELYVIGGFIKKENYDKFNGSIRSDKTQVL